MDHLLTEHGLCLTYLQDARTIGDLDQERIIDDMSDDTSEGDPLPWLTRYRLAEYDHLVLVTDRSSGRYLAFLGANDGATERENFLLLEAAFVTRSARGQNLMRRMIALALLRIGGIGPTPSVVAACSRNPLCYRVMHETARRFTGATFFPDPGSIAIDFRTATLARRIACSIAPNQRFQTINGTVRGGVLPSGADIHRALSHDPRIDRLFGSQLEPADRMLMVIDAREVDEGTILRDARRMYRAR
jgi:hypothetical protein